MIKRGEGRGEMEKKEEAKCRTKRSKELEFEFQMKNWLRAIIPFSTVPKSLATTVYAGMKIEDRIHTVNVKKIFITARVCGVMVK